MTSCRSPGCAAQTGIETISPRTRLVSDLHDMPQSVLPSAWCFSVKLLIKAHVLDQLKLASAEGLGVHLLVAERAERAE